MKSVSVVIFVLLVVLSIVASFYFYSGSNTNEREDKEKIMLLSFPEIFCALTEQSKPYAFIEFAYQEEGEIRYIKTKTTCENFEDKVGNSYPKYFGEKVIFQQTKPLTIKREDGKVYEYEPTEPTRSFFKTNINFYENPNNLPQFLNYDKFVAECEFLINQNEHDICLAIQSTEEKNKSLTWVDNIKDDKLNSQEIEQRYLNNPKFCIKEEDCVSYTMCDNQNEPRNKFYNNSLTPNYNPEQKCLLDYFAYQGSDVKCENNSCEYRRCYPLWDASCGSDTGGGICAGTYYASECLDKSNKEECEVVDVYRASTSNFGDSDGIPDCEWK